MKSNITEQDYYKLSILLDTKVDSENKDYIKKQLNKYLEAEELLLQEIFGDDTYINELIISINEYTEEYRQMYGLSPYEETVIDKMKSEME